jgi:hypothetical protein
MKKIVFVCFLFLSSKAHSQIDHVAILVGKTDKEVSAYMDSLNSLKPNRYYKIQTDLAKDGDKMLTADYGLADEPYLKCHSIIVRFKRIDGLEICVLQGILGKAEYGVDNINYIKDNFKEMDTGIWQTTIRIGTVDIKVKASLEVDKDSYSITYRMVD